MTKITVSREANARLFNILQITDIAGRGYSS
jgi:hypothetical protein